MNTSMETRINYEWRSTNWWGNVCCIMKIIITCCPWSHGLRPKKLSVSVAVPPAPVRVPIQRPLAQSVASLTSVANDTDDNEMILGGCEQISWHLRYSRGNPQKTSARRPSDEGVVRPVIASNGVHSHQMRSVGSHSTSGSQKDGVGNLFFLKPGGFQLSALARGDREPSYAYVSFYPPDNSVSWWQAAFEWGSV